MLSLDCNYDAHSSVLKRLKRRGAVIKRSEVVIVGKKVRVFYSVSDVQQQNFGHLINGWDNLIRPSLYELEGF